jgi:hypothetical protein
MTVKKINEKRLDMILNYGMVASSNRSYVFKGLKR